MLHVRLNLITADPIALRDSIRYLETEVRQEIKSQRGSLGMSLQANTLLGVAILESFWASGDALRDSENVVPLSRQEAVRRADATVTVERYQVPVFEGEASLATGEGVRLTRMDVKPAMVEDAVAWFGDIAVPWLADTDGFCSALLYVDRTSGHSIIESVWRDAQALAASRSAAAAIRVDAVTATNCVIRAVEQYRLVFSSARTA